jgi:hypothetical protein
MPRQETNPKSPLTKAKAVRNTRGERVRVRLQKFKGKDQVDIRAWYRADDNELKPSPRGIRLSVDQLPRFARILGRKCRLAHTRGLIP